VISEIDRKVLIVFLFLPITFWDPISRLSFAGIHFNINHSNRHAECISQSDVFHKGARGSVVVKTLCYKPEGHGSETR
jgi:hypothetical protein